MCLLMNKEADLPGFAAFVASVTSTPCSTPCSTLQHRVEVTDATNAAKPGRSASPSSAGTPFGSGGVGHGDNEASIIKCQELNSIITAYEGKSSAVILNYIQQCNHSAMYAQRETLQYGIDQVSRLWYRSLIREGGTMRVAKQHHQ